MNIGGILADLKRIWAEMPAHPVSPENRDAARLHVTPYIRRGQLFRVTPDPAFFTDPDTRPRILIHPEDANVLRAQFTSPFGPISDQGLADLAEQLFAEQEARGRK